MDMKRCISVVLLVVLSAGCLSVPGGITAPTETSLEAYPDGVPEPVVIVAPDNRSDAIARSVAVLDSHLQRADVSSSIVSHAAFDPQNGSGTAVVLAPDGQLPESLANEVATPESENETTATVFTADRSTPGVSDVVVLSGGDWGIRTGVDDLTGRTDGSLSGQRATVHAEIDTYEGTVVRRNYAEFYALLFETNDDVYMLTVAPERLEQNEPINATVRAYETEFSQPVLGSNRVDPTTMTAPALEIVSVLEGGDS